MSIDRIKWDADHNIYTTIELITTARESLSMNFYPESINLLRDSINRIMIAIEKIGYLEGRNKKDENYSNNYSYL